MSENNTDNSYYIEYYMLNAWWGNDWVAIAFCGRCGTLFAPDNMTFNVYKIKKECYNLFFYQSCYEEIKKRHADLGTKWEGTIHWHGDPSHLQ